MSDKPFSTQIDDIIANVEDWRGKRLSELRDLIKQASPEIVEEVKWKKPSKPEGVPVWSHEGIICVGEMLKNAVRLTFPKGALLDDSKKIFNSRLESKSVRAVDFHENDVIEVPALIALTLQAAKLNESKEK